MPPIAPTDPVVVIWSCCTPGMVPPTFATTVPALMATLPLPIFTTSGPPTVRSVPPFTVRLPLPNAVPLPAPSVPALSVVPPVKVFAPLSVWKPVPFFTKASGAPAPFWIVPLNVVLVFNAPVVSVAARPVLFCTVPPAVPESEPIVLLLPPRSSVPPAFTVVAEFTPKAEVEPASSEPPFTVVVPV